MDDKVLVTSMVRGLVSISIPAIRFQKTWPTKGTKLKISKDVLREAIYEPGVEYMFKNGILYIDDMDFKIELGLENEGTKTPTEIIPVDEKYLNRVLRLIPVADMKEAIEKMNPNQRQELIDYAIKQNDIQLDRISIIDQVCNVNILKSIELRKQMEE